jgi:hypothetical protein
MIDQETFNAQLEASFHDELEKIALGVPGVSAGLNTVRTAVQSARAAPSPNGSALIGGLRARLKGSEKRMGGVIEKRYARAATLKASPLAGRVGKAGDAVRAQAQRLHESAGAYQSGRAHLYNLATGGP